jgi:hypothetical protein
MRLYKLLKHSKKRLNFASGLLIVGRQIIVTIIMMVIISGCTQKSPITIITPNTSQVAPGRTTKVTICTNIEPTQVIDPLTQTMQPTLSVPLSTITSISNAPPERILHYQCLNVAQTFPTQSEPPAGKLILVGSTSFAVNFLSEEKLNYPIGAENFTISPNGKWLAYRIYTADPTQGLLVVDSLDNEQEVRLPWRKEWLSIKDWTVDDHLLINRQRKPLSTILSLDPFQNQITEVLPILPDVYQTTTAMSFLFRTSNIVPDSTLQRIIYPQQVDGRYYVAFWDNKTKRILAKIEDLYPFDHDPIWKVNGQSFLIPIVTRWKDQPQRKEMVYEWFLVNQEGHIEQLTHLGDYFSQSIIEAASLSPDGQFLAFFLSVQPSPYEGQQLAVINLETNVVTNYCIPGSVGRAVKPVWSPDNRYIAIQDIYTNNAWRVIVVDTKQGWAANVSKTYDQYLPAGWLP